MPTIIRYKIAHTMWSRVLPDGTTKAQAMDEIEKVHVKYPSAVLYRETTTLEILA